MKRNLLLFVVGTLTVCNVLSQTVTDSVCFDFATAQKIEIDLIELDDYKAKDSLRKADLNDLKKIIITQDSIIRNNALQMDIQGRIGDLEVKQEKNKKGWLKWLFAAIGVVIGVLVR